MSAPAQGPWWARFGLSLLLTFFAVVFGAAGGLFGNVATELVPADWAERNRTLVVTATVVLALAAAVSSMMVVVVERQRGATSVAAQLAVTAAVGATGDRWPVLGEVELDVLGVRLPRESTGRPRAQLLYVPRAADADLRKALGTHRFVLVHGPAGVGKSRSTAAMCTGLFGGRPVVVPAVHEGALRKLVDGDAVPGGAVVWLDDLDRHLQAGVDDALVRRLLALDQVRVVATMRAAAYEQLKPVGDVRPPGREVVELANQVEYGDWNPDDRAEAARRLTDHPDVVAALGKGVGLGAYLSVGPDLVDRLQAGSPPPGGVAVVHAAADWYRAGMTRPAPAQLVQDLYPLHLPQDDATLLDRYDEALTWATTPVSGARLVSRRTDGSGLAVHDFVLDHLTTTLPPGLPEPAWSGIAAALDDDPDALVTVAATAYNVHGDAGTAERLLTGPATTGHAGATLTLGALLVATGRAVEGERWYRRGADAGDSSAMYNLGNLLLRRGDLPGAERFYRDALIAGHHDAMVNLGVVLMEQGEYEDAEWWLQRAAAAADIEGMVNLGVLLDKLGRVEEAKDTYRAALAIGRTEAMVNLGALLGRQGDEGQEEAWYREAAALGDADGMYFLAQLYDRQGRPADARRWYEKAAAAGHPAAMVHLGLLRLGRDEYEAAEDRLRNAAAAGNTDAMVNLGNVLARREATAEAEQWYRTAITAGHPGGMANLGGLMLARGNTVEAEHWFRHAAAAGHLAAMVSLGTLLVQRGNSPEAAHWFQTAAAAGYLEGMHHLLDLRAGPVHGPPPPGSESEPPGQTFTAAPQA